MTVEQALAEIDDETKALKTWSPISMGRLEFPGETPTATYTGTFNSASPSQIQAKVRATFTRTDGKPGAPMVEFAFTYQTHPTYKEYMESMGAVVTDKDLAAYEESYVKGHVVATGENSVSFDIDINNGIAPFGEPNKSLAITVAAYSTVNGELTLERVI